MKASQPQLVSNHSPIHVAIIMDGNGRWAESRGLSRAEGHAQGAEAARRTIKASIDLGIEYLTLFGFSLENWGRPAGEISDLMGLLRVYLRKEIEELDREGVKLKFIGDRTLLEPDIVSLLDASEQRTKDNSRLTVILALSYGSRQEIAEAARRIACEALSGKIDPKKIDEDAISERLFTREIPDPDLIVRTSGEKRISNFMLWQSAYAEFVFMDVLWPDFCKEDLEKSIEEFSRRERRYGTTSG